MPQSLVTKQITAPIIKASDLPEDVQKAGEGQDIDMWFYASVEVPDHENDIVRIAGVDTTKFAQNGPVKFISSHSRKPSEDGRLPVVGKAVTWIKTTHKSLGAPALVAGVKFAPTDLGQEMKKLYDGGFLTDVSIGAQSLKAEPIKGGGIDYQQTAVAELSACINGMNQFAGVLRALDTELDTDDTLELDADEPDPLFELYREQHQLFADTIKQLTERLDNIESTLDGRADEAQQRPVREPVQDKEADTFKAIAEAFDRLASHPRLQPPK